MKRALAATAVATLLLAACSSSSSSSTGAALSSTSATPDAISVQLTEFAFVMPDLIPVRDSGGEVIDARLSTTADLTLQMLRYSGKLPLE